MEKHKVFSFIVLFFLILITTLSCTMGGANPFSAKKQLSVEYPPENAIIRDTFLMSGRILTEKTLESVEISFTEIGVINPKKYGPYQVEIDQTEKRWQLELNALVDTEFPIFDGKYDVLVESIDLHQNKTRISRVYTIDNTAPVVVLTSPVSNDIKNSWEFTSRLMFTGSVFDTSSSTVLHFYFYNEDMELITEYKKEVKPGPWVFQFDTQTELYKTLLNSESNHIYFTLEAEDLAFSYTSFLDVLPSIGNRSNGFYLSQDFSLEQNRESSLSARSLYARITDSPLSLSEVSFNLHKADILTKKRSIVLDNQDVLTVFNLNPIGDAPYIQAPFLLQQRGDSLALKNFVSAKESLFFEFHRGSKGATFLDDMSYSLKKKEGEEWVFVYPTGKKIQVSNEILLQKTDIDDSALFESQNPIYVHEAPEILGDYKIEFFIRDIDGVLAQDQVWFFTVVEASPTIFVEIKEIDPAFGLLLNVHSISSTEDTVLNVKNMEGFFDEKLKAILPTKTYQTSTGLFEHFWELALKIDNNDKNLSNLIFEIESAEQINRLYKNLSLGWNQGESLEKDSLKDLGSLKQQEIKASDTQALQGLLQSSMDSETEIIEMSFIKPSIKINANTRDFDIHYDRKGEYFNLGFLEGKTIIPLETTNLEAMYLKEGIENTQEVLITTFEKINSQQWNLIIEDPQFTIHGIVELVGVDKDGFETNIRIKLAFDKEAPFIKVDTLKNNFYNKDHSLYISGLSFDYSSQANLQSGIDNFIEYAIIQTNEDTIFDFANENVFNWTQVIIENPLDWSFYIDPEVFADDSWYSIFVRIRDKSGNYSILSENSFIQLYVDSQAPLIKLGFEKKDDREHEAQKVFEDFSAELPAVLNIEGYIEEKTFAKDGLAYWAYEKKALSDTGEEIYYEVVDLIQYTLGNYFSIEDSIEEKGEYSYVFTAKDLAGNTSTVEYFVLVH